MPYGRVGVRSRTCGPSLRKGCVVMTDSSNEATLTDEITILLGDEQSLFREAVRRILEDEPDIRVVADVKDGEQAIDEAVRHRPDLGFLSVTLPRTDGISAMSAILDRVPGCRVAILARDPDERTLFDAVDAGARGYLTMDMPLAGLIDAARSMHRGETLIPPLMLGGLLERLAGRRREQSDALRRLAQLTRREREVLSLLVQGADNEAIAGRLTISPQTARTHVQNLLGKLGVHSRLEAAAYVHRASALSDLLPGIELDGSAPDGNGSAANLAGVQRATAR